MLKCVGLVLLLCVGMLGPLRAATYYVDFDAGNDANDGLAAATAWKRAPGDPAATGRAATAAPGAGDTILFKGGVTYRGWLTVTRSGASGSPLVYKGDGWGSGKAVIEGADPYQAFWTACPSAAACGNNANYQKIFYAAAPSGYSSFLTGLFENGELLWYSQGPNPSDPFYHDETEDFYSVPYPNTNVIQNQGSITDPRVLTQASATFWSGASVVGWITGNIVSIQPVTSFDPASHTLFHQAFPSAPYKDRAGRYALMNHVSLIDRPGEYAFDAAAGRIYLWPRSGAAPNSNSYSVNARETAFLADAAIRYVTLEGFSVQHFTYGFQVTSTSASNVIVRGNEIVNTRSKDKYAIFVNARDSLVEGNRVYNANRAVGILSSADNITIRANHVERASRQGIWLMGAKNSKIVDNTVVNIGGSHSNGISIYSGSSNITVSGNRVLHVNSPITFEESADLVFSNNVVHPGGQISDWFGMSGTVSFLNNTFPGSTFYQASSPNYVFRNNVLRTAPPKGTRSHNLYTAGGVALQTGERIEADLGRIFAAHASNDFRLRSGSPAIDAGTPVSVAVDQAGVARPQGAAWDIGAFEFNSTPVVPLAPPTNLRVQ